VPENRAPAHAITDVKPTAYQTRKRLILNLGLASSGVTTRVATSLLRGPAREVCKVIVNLGLASSVPGTSARLCN
jgi:hypothetical protein